MNLAHAIFMPPNIRALARPKYEIARRSFPRTKARTRGRASAKNCVITHLKTWCRHPGLNRGPTDYEVKRSATDRTGDGSIRSAH